MTWTLMLDSFRVLRQDKKLALFPVLSGLAAAAVGAPYLLLLTGRPFSWPVLIAGYFSLTFVMLFFNCALAYSAYIRFSGGEPTLSAGLSRAAARTGSILVWSLVASTVGLLLEWLEEQIGWIGRIAMTLVGLGWNMATFLIVPVLVLEDRSVVESIRRSASLLRQTWGEQLCSVIAFGWYTVLFVLAGIAVGAVGGWFLAIPYFVLLAIVFTAARQIFTVALYRYAATGEPPAGFSGDAMYQALLR